MIEFNQSQLRFGVAAFALAMLTAPASKAALMDGILTITGSVRADSDSLDFLPASGPSGAFVVDMFTQTGDFTPLAGTTGTVLDLDRGDQPVGSLFTLPNWLTFTAHPSLNFTLTFIDPGVFSPDECANTPAAGQTCTPPGSQFNLNNVTADSSVASFVVRGLVTDGSGDPASTFVGVFTAAFTNNSYQELLIIISEAGIVQPTYSANFVVTAIPEPGTIALLLLGGLGLGLGSLRRKMMRY